MRRQRRLQDGRGLKDIHGVIRDCRLFIFQNDDLRTKNVLRCIEIFIYKVYFTLK